MITRRTTLLGLAASAFASTLAARLTALASGIGARVTVVINSVTSKPNAAAEPAPVSEGEDLPPETEVATAKESAAEFTFADGSTLIIGQRSLAGIAPPDARATLTKGAFRFRSAEAANATLTTPLLSIDARAAEFVVAVAEGQTICGVVSGEITCTSIKKGTAAKVGAGESIAWVAGSFGDGVTKGVYQTADLAVDEGLEAARAAWSPL